MIVRID